MLRATRGEKGLMFSCAQVVKLIYKPQHGACTLATKIISNRKGVLAIDKGIAGVQNKQC